MADGDLVGDPRFASSSDYLRTGSPLRGPDPTGQNPGFGAPVGQTVPAVGTATPGAPAAGRGVPGRVDPMSAMMRQLGPYASIGIMAGAAGGKKGIIAAPLVALAMQQLLKQQRRKTSNPNVISEFDSVPGANAGNAGPSPMAKGGQVKENKVRREFRSNGPKVTNLPVSPRKAMGMKLMSPESIPTLKRGGKVPMVKDTDHDGMARGGKVKEHEKYALCARCGGEMAHGGKVCKACGGAVRHHAGGGPVEHEVDHVAIHKGSAKNLKPGSKVHYEARGGKVAKKEEKKHEAKVHKYAKGGLIPRGSNMTTRGTSGSHFE